MDRFNLYGEWIMSTATRNYNRPAYVTATEYGVSCTSGTDIVGVLLSVYKVARDGPGIEFAVKDMPFATHEEADAYALANGWIKEYVSQRERQS